MKIKVVNYIANFFVERGIEHVFTVTGGGAMHLNDAFGHHEKLTCVYNHHEQASAIAAEGYTRYSGKLAVVCVTSGPGGTNAITGVLGGWLDSIPMFVISGQVKRETTIYATDLPLRQLGDQEFNIVSSVSSMTKYAHIVLNPAEIRYHLEKAYYLCLNGRGGPVWLDIPLDVQAAIIETDELVGFDETSLSYKEKPVYDTNLSERILDLIANSKKPVVFAGTGIRLSGAYQAFLELVNKLQIPVVTAWNAHDVLWNTHPYYCGRPGTVGTRGGNFVVQNADLLFVLGCRLNIRQISYNYRSFAPNAYKIIVDIDKSELYKPTIKADLPVYADLKDVVKDMCRREYTPVHMEWLKWCRNIDAKYPATLSEYYDSSVLNPYAFITKFSEGLKKGDSIVCGNGSACVITFQAFCVKNEQRLFTNSGCAAMGYGFPAAIGVCKSRNGKRVICIDGDGSFQMNIQELQTVVYNHLNLKIIYLNNNGYHSIRQTQTNLFQPPLVGVCDGNGLSFPEAERIANAYEIPFIRVSSLGDIEKLLELMEQDGPLFAEVVVDPKQNFSPKLSSKVLPDGKIVSPPIDDMFPFLSREEYESNVFRG
ncbi:thiamine pyrophosphate-binding protein [Mediterranea massiliensis]|uniref:Thiamine pyrophosphate-binding protein n=1 Tax=Mediterranea massiliensis TaxID=1841865 RepID=A0ABS2E3J8_9BACT|nr:thiamine pyrophosphate-binding protein [Mediterranea massiliensis]MBM6736178.1 thiamine pyrophosphate-binding protein [Mediterranea massiliensis]